LVTLIFATARVVPGDRVAERPARLRHLGALPRRACINEAGSISSELKGQVLGSGRLAFGLPAPGIKPGTGAVSLSVFEAVVE
jgi:hypothetical protein